MQLIRTATILVIASIGVARASGDTVARSVPGGWCVIASSITITDAGSDPNDYHIDSVTGRLTIKTPGLWQVFYKVSPNFSDPNPQYIDFVGVDVVPNGTLGFNVPVWGKNLTGTCNFGGVGLIAIRLLQGGSIGPNGQIFAPQYDLETDGSRGPAIEVGASLTRLITVRTIGANSSVLVRGDISGVGEIRAGDVAGTIHALGNHSGRVWVQGSLSGKILFDGSMAHGGFINEVLVSGTMATTGTIVVDYDGWHSTHNWISGATVAVGGSTYGVAEVNHTPHRIYRVTACRGDMNNDEVVSTLDNTGFLADDSVYRTTFPGLDGSRYFHADCDQDGQLWMSGSPFADDQVVYDGLKLYGCCVTNCADRPCDGDIDMDGDVDLQDLTLLLSEFGLSGSAVIYPCSDFNSDGVIDISDLSILLSHFGTTCACFTSGFAQGGGESGGGAEKYEDGGASISVTAERVDPSTVRLAVSPIAARSDRDFFVAGIRALPAEGMRFAVGDPTDIGGPDSPRSCLLASCGDSGADALHIAGSLVPEGLDWIWSERELNIVWADTCVIPSDESPIATITLTSDVGGLGTGQPYFSTRGPIEESDRLLAEIRVVIGGRGASVALQAIDGGIYVSTR